MWLIPQSYVVLICYYNVNTVQLSIPREFAITLLFDRVSTDIRYSNLLGNLTFKTCIAYCLTLSSELLTRFQARNPIISSEFNLFISVR